MENKLKKEKQDLCKGREEWWRKEGDKGKRTRDGQGEWALTTDEQEGDCGLWW